MLTTINTAVLFTLVYHKENEMSIDMDRSGQTWLFIEAVTE